MNQQIFGEIDQKLDTVPSQGAIAQLVERFHGMEEVRGSIPLSSTGTNRESDTSSLRLQQSIFIIIACMRRNLVQYINDSDVDTVYSAYA